MTNSGVLTSVYTISANRSHVNGTQNTTVHGSSVTVNLGFTPAAGTLLVVGCNGKFIVHDVNLRQLLRAC